MQLNHIDIANGEMEVPEKAPDRNIFSLNSPYQNDKTIPKKEHGMFLNETANCCVTDFAFDA